LQKAFEREFERSGDETAGSATARRVIAAEGPRSRPARLRRFARRRRLLAMLLLASPAAVCVSIDLARRADRILALDWLYKGTYAAAAVESLVLWSVLLYAASRRRGFARWISAALFVIFVTFSFGGQTYFYEQYHAYLNVDVSLFASNFMDSVVNQLSADIGNYLAAKAPPLIGACALVFFGRKLVRPRRRRALVANVVAPLLLVASFFIPTQHRHLQAATPDVLYLHAIGGLLRTQLGMTDQSNQLRPRVRESLPVPALAPRDGPPRNVLLIILESVRSDAVCVDYDPDCKRTPYSNKLAPGRYPFNQMRSMASSTAISLAVLWSGVGPHESRDVLHTWPLLFDYARAAGWDTAFWTSQNMMFGNARLWVKNLGVSAFISATDLDPTCDLDMGAPEHLLAAHVNREIGKLKEPFLAVVQLSNVHYPYLLDENGPQPFQPATTSKDPDVNGSFFNHYQNAVHQQDRHIASMIGHLRSTEPGKRTVIVYTSDHGEAFREHHQMGHTFSVFDEEIKVPGWIDAPPGTLDEASRKNLLRKRDEFLFHVDIAPTVLDLMGVWDDSAIAQYKSKMMGTSLLRPEVTTRALPLTNCAGVWSCAFENWGYMQRNMKIEARSWNEGWQCFDLEKDAFELENLGSAACGDLEQRAVQTFGRLPGVQPEE
jgi:glucan phosphoethanolaminetransferase (alkaline phosphatase superfamily)